MLLLINHPYMKPSTPLMLDGTKIERVTVYKLLGIHISYNLKWAHHVNMLASKVASRLYFLKQLKRTGAPTEDLVCFYIPQSSEQCLNTLVLYAF